jgi:hypothetical protein
MDGPRRLRRKLTRRSPAQDGRSRAILTQRSIRIGWPRIIVVVKGAPEGTQIHPGPVFLIRMSCGGPAFGWIRQKGLTSEKIRGRLVKEASR